MSHNKNKHSFLKMTALALGCMAVYNTYEYNKATSGNHNHREECRVYTGRFGDIYYKHYGSGSPVLLLHTLEPSANMSEWIASATELGKSHSVYVIDLPGCGFSDKSTIDYSIYMYALAVNDFVKNRILRHHDTATGMHAAAISTSSAILICAALTAPKLYSGLSLSIRRLWRLPTAILLPSLYLQNVSVQYITLLLSVHLCIILNTTALP